MTDSKEDLAIHAQGLTKIYPRSSASGSLRTMALRLARKSPVGPKALDDINLTVPKGQALGIVGRNGSGKSTLLRMLAGVLRPTEGSITLQGRLGTLLDLGSGIHPEYSGAENALVLGMLAGLSKSEVRARMSAIREFSGLGEAFDHPAKTYSSGMTLRLGFSAAIHSDPDVLLIDEALAVGDAFFQQRCLARLRRLREEGTTIVLVSHDPSAVISLCDRAIWLEHGRVSADDSPAEVIKQYLAARYRDNCELDAPLAPLTLEGDPAKLEFEDDEPPLRSAAPIERHDDRFGDGRARVVGMEVRDDAGKPISSVSAGVSVSVVLTIRSHDQLTMPLVGFTLRNRLGDVVTATNTELEGIYLPPLEKGDEIDVAFRFSWPPLSSGSFSFSPAIAEGSIASHRMCDWVENVWILEAVNSRGLFGWMTLDNVSVTTGNRRPPCGTADRLAASSASPEAEPTRIEFSLETPRTTIVEQDQITGNAELFLSGWCFATSGEPVELTARVGSASSRTVAVAGFRQDVGRVHSGVPNACRSGFGVLVPVPITPGPARCHIEASVQGRSTTVAEFELDLPAQIRILKPRETARRRPKSRPTPGNRRRVLFVSHSLNLEGAPRSLFEMANALDSSRFDKRLCSPTAGPFEKTWAEAGIPTSHLEWDPCLTSEDDFAAQIRRLAGLASVWRPDLIVANTLETFWAIHLAVELGRPSVWIVRESETPEAYFHSRLPTPIAERARAALSLADRIVFVANSTRELFVHDSNESRARLIHNGLDLARFDLSTIPSARAKIRRKLRLSENTPLLLCVGTTCPRKAQLELIHALGKLRDSRPDFHCVFLGVVEGEYLAAMRVAIKDLGLGRNVTLRKPVLDARPFFAAADVTICNSYQESLPRVVLESMGFARPIVASRVFGIPELVRDEVDALLVEPGDIESLSKAIERQLSNPTMARALGESARLRAEEKFSLAGCVAKFSDLFDELLDDSTEASH